MKIKNTLADVKSKLKTQDKVEQLTSVYVKTQTPMYR
jgi:hypothetical protein